MNKERREMRKSDSGTLTRHNVPPQTGSETRSGSFFFKQGFSQCVLLRRVDPQNGNSRPANGCSANEQGPFPSEMPFPPMSTRMEETNQFSGDWIDARNIWAFEAVAIKACQRQICGIGLSPVFSGNDVVDFEGKERAGLGKVTILASRLRSFFDPLDKNFIHRMISFSKRIASRKDGLSSASNPERARHDNNSPVHFVRFSSATLPGFSQRAGACADDRAGQNQAGESRGRLPGTDRFSWAG